MVAPGGTGVIYRVGTAFQALNTGQTATETFTYTMRDAAGAQSTAIVTVVIAGANEPPVYIYPPPPTSVGSTSGGDDVHKPFASIYFRSYEW